MNAENMNTETYLLSDEELFDKLNLEKLICKDEIVGMGSVKTEEKTTDSVIETSTGVIIAPSTGVAPHQAIGGGMIFAAIVLAALTIIFSKTKKDEVEE